MVPHSHRSEESSTSDTLTVHTRVHQVLRRADIADACSDQRSKHGTPLGAFRKHNPLTVGLTRCSDTLRRGPLTDRHRTFPGGCGVNRDKPYRGGRTHSGNCDTPSYEYTAMVGVSPSRQFQPARPPRHVRHSNMFQRRAHACPRHTRVSSAINCAMVMHCCVLNRTRIGLCQLKSVELATNGLPRQRALDRAAGVSG